MEVQKIYALIVAHNILREKRNQHEKKSSMIEIIVQYLI